MDQDKDVIAAKAIFYRGQAMPGRWRTVRQWTPGGGWSYVWKNEVSGMVFRDRAVDGWLPVGEE